MAEHPNAVPIHKSFGAFARGDMATMRSLVAEDTVWHIPGRVRWRVITTAATLSHRRSRSTSGRRGSSRAPR
jgi:ketosteroid isomerase-like protein